MADPIISPKAQADLNSTWDYLAERDLSAADRCHDEFWAAASRYTSFPRTGRSREDLRPGLRRFVVGKHVDFFLLDTDTIRIVRALHGSRDVDRIMSDTSAS